MNEQVDTEANLKLKVASLEGELNAIRTTNVAIYDETIKSTKIFQVLVVILGLTAGYFTIWSTDRVDKTISQAEQRISSLTGGFVPKRARVQSLTRDNKLFVELSIKEGKAFGIKGYRVGGQTTAEIVIEGDVPGRILGFQAELKGNFVDEILGASFFDAPTELEFKRPKFFSASNSVNGVLLPPEVPYSISYYFSFLFKSCEDAKQFASRAVDENLKLTAVLRPILEESREVVAGREFATAVVNRASNFDCQAEINNLERLDELSS